MSDCVIQTKTLLTAKRIGSAVLCFYSKTGVNLDKILHTPIVVRSTLVGRLRPRSVHGRLQAKPERLCFFVIPVTHPKSYMETTDRRDFGGKPSKWRWGRVKNSGIFLAWPEPDSKNIFRVLGYPSTILRTAYRKQFYPQPIIPMKDETLKVCLLLVCRVSDQAHFADIGRKWSHDHYENRKFADRGRKKSLIPKMIYIGYSFLSTTKNNEVIKENRFRIVASPGACERLAVLNWRSSSIHPSS